MFANGLGDLGSIPGRVIPKTQKMVLDASLLNTQHYKVRIKGKVDSSLLNTQHYKVRIKGKVDSSLLNTQHYKVWIKGKVEQSWEGVAPSPTPWCSSYRKGSLRVTLDYGRQLYLLIYNPAKMVHPSKISTKLMVAVIKPEESWRIYWSKTCFIRLWISFINHPS